MVNLNVVKIEPQLVLHKEEDISSMVQREGGIEHLCCFLCTRKTALQSLMTRDRVRLIALYLTVSYIALGNYGKCPLPCLFPQPSNREGKLISTIVEM